VGEEAAEGSGIGEADGVAEVAMPTTTTLGTPILAKAAEHRHLLLLLLLAVDEFRGERRDTNGFHLERLGPILDPRLTANTRSKIRSDRADFLRRTMLARSEKMFGFFAFDIEIDCSRDPFHRLKCRRYFSLGIVTVALAFSADNSYAAAGLRFSTVSGIHVLAAR
jgi:hypothetical protein